MSILDKINSAAVGLATTVVTKAAAQNKARELADTTMEEFRHVISLPSDKIPATTRTQLEAMTKAWLEATIASQLTAQAAVNDAEAALAKANAELAKVTTSLDEGKRARLIQIRETMNRLDPTLGVSLFAAVPVTAAPAPAV